MKRVYLSVLMLLLCLSGCKKEDDPVDDPVVTDPAKGRITFYVKLSDVGRINLPVVIMINDSVYEDNLNGAASSSPTCDQPSTLGRRVWLTPGTHSFLAYDEDSLWTHSGFITSVSDVCKLQRLQ